MIPADLQTPLQFMKGVGPRRAADLQRVGLVTIEDFLYRFPIRYEDRGAFQRDGAELHFESAAYGDRFEGEVHDGIVWLYYDWCADGNHDVDFAFEQ